MSFDIGQLFSNSWETIKQRFWPLVGMVLIFYVFQVIFFGVLATFMGGSMMALAGAGSGLDSSAALTGLGAGFILMMLVGYLAYFVILFAQQCAMAMLATPLKQTQFGDAIIGGFKGGLTFLGVTILLIIAYFVLGLAMLLIGGIFSLLGEVGGLVTGLALFLFIPVIIYLAVRLSVLVPVVAVDEIRNPFTAIARTWSLTSGHALAIFVVFVVLIVASLLLVGVPMLLIFGSLTSGDPSGAIGAVLGLFALMIPLYVIYAVISIVVLVSIHAEITDMPGEDMAETFE